MARQVKLPKPDLLSEFERHTGSTHFKIFTIESIIEAFSLDTYNREAQGFRHLALAIKLDARTPTEAVVQWFLKNPKEYAEALDGVCHWDFSPDEVEQEAFKAWTVAKMKNVDVHNVRWSDVFCEFFL